MIWWQILLIIVGAIAVAILFGRLLGNFISNKWAWPFPAVLRRITAVNFHRKVPGERIYGVIEKYNTSTARGQVIDDLRKAKQQSENARLIPGKELPANLNKLRESQIPAGERALQDMLATKGTAKQEIRGILKTQEVTKSASLKTVLQANGEVPNSGDKVDTDIIEKKHEQQTKPLTMGKPYLPPGDEKARREANEVKGKAHKEIIGATAIARTEQERMANEKARQQTEERLKAIEESEASRLKPEALRQIEINQTMIFAELRANLKIAITPPTGKLQPFLTNIWNNYSAVQNVLPAEMMAELKEAYTDINLANNIVYLLTEMGAPSTSKGLEAGYVELCGKIAESLSKVLK